jgi:hypothetical protein
MASVVAVVGTRVLRPWSSADPERTREDFSMPDLSYPSTALPSLPQLSVTLPEDWTALPPGRAMLRAQGPQRSGGPSPTVVVEAHTEAAGTTAEDLLARLADESDHSAQAEPPFQVELTGRTWTGINRGWAHASGPQVEVRLATSLGDGSGDGSDTGEHSAYARLITVTGCVGGPSVDEDYDLLQSVMETIRVEERS